MNQYQKLPHTTAEFEKFASCCIASMAKNTEKNNQDLKTLYFCSPLSTRDPEVDDFWHPIFLKNKNKYFIIRYPLKMAHSLLAGMYKFTKKKFGSYETIEKDNPQGIWILSPSNLVIKTKNKITTSYYSNCDSEKSSWIIFDSTQSTKNNIISRKTILSIYIRLALKTSTHFLFHKPKHINVSIWFYLHQILINWVISLNWAHLLTIQKAINKIVSTENVSLLSCPHEMFPHSRMLWAEARKHGIHTKIVQHAMLDRWKLWYFPSKEEILSGLPTPNNFHVYNEETKQLLKEYYFDTTKFSISQSPRFSTLDNIVPTKNKNDKSETKTLLFLSSLAWWDNKIIIEEINHLCAKIHISTKFKVIFRPHPFSNYKNTDLKTINSLINNKFIEYSKVSLKEDLDRSDVVIIFSSSSIIESLLHSKPTIQIGSDDFLFGICGINLPTHKRLSEYDIHDCFLKKNIVTIQENLLRTAYGSNKEIFSLNNP